MMITNIDYASMVEKARASGASKVDFGSAVQPVEAIKGQQDTVTLSKQALALMNGDSSNTEEAAPTYIKPETARSLLAQSKAESGDAEEQEKSTNFSEVMQKILDQRTGVDRKKLDEINAMIEEIANNEDMSPEEKEKAMEMLEKMKEEIIEESIELQKVAKQTDKPEDKV